MKHAVRETRQRISQSSVLKEAVEIEIDSGAVMDALCAHRITEEIYCRESDRKPLEQ